MKSPSARVSTLDTPLVIIVFGHVRYVSIMSALPPSLLILLPLGSVLCQTPVSLSGLFQETSSPSLRHIKKGDRLVTLFARHERALFPIHRERDQGVAPDATGKTVARMDVDHTIDNGRARAVK